MKRFWRGEHHDIEAELRSCRPEPRREFLAALSGRLDARMRRPNAVRRVAFASAVTVGMLTVFATLGGIGYASSAAKNAIEVTKVEKLVGISHSNSSQVNASHVNGKDEGKDENDGDNDEDDNPGEHEYRPGKGCGDKNHIHLRENECKKHHHHHEHEHGDKHGHDD